MSGVRVPPGGTLGILGGGQLGRMLALAAAELGIQSHIYCPDKASPAFQIADRYTCAAYEDPAALAAFAESVDAITYEFENIPAATAAILSAARPVLPAVRALETTADRLTEKIFVRSLGIGTAEFRAVDSHADLASAVAALGFSADRGSDQPSQRETVVVTSGASSPSPADGNRTIPAPAVAAVVNGTPSPATTRAAGRRPSRRSARARSSAWRPPPTTPWSPPGHRRCWPVGRR